LRPGTGVPVRLQGRPRARVACHAREAGAQVAEAALADEHVRGGERLDLQRRILRLGKPPRRWRRPAWAAALPREPPEARPHSPSLHTCTHGCQCRMHGRRGDALPLLPDPCSAEAIGHARARTSSSRSRGACARPSGAPGGRRRRPRAPGAHRGPADHERAGRQEPLLGGRRQRGRRGAAGAAALRRARDRRLEGCAPLRPCAARGSRSPATVLRLI